MRYGKNANLNKECPRQRTFATRDLLLIETSVWKISATIKLDIVWRDLDLAFFYFCATFNFMGY